MWQILGANAMYVEFADLWKYRMNEIAEDRDDGKKFIELMKDVEVSHMLNGTTEVHTFYVELPRSLTPEDIQFLADVILDVANTSEVPFISLEGDYQKCQVIFSNDVEPELIGLDKTEGFSSGAAFQPVFTSWGKPNKTETMDGAHIYNEGHLHTLGHTFIR